MLLVLVLGVGASFAADSNQTDMQASDDTDTVVSITETNAVSSNDNDTVISVNENSGETLSATTGTFTELQSSSNCNDSDKLYKSDSDEKIKASQISVSTFDELKNAIDNTEYSQINLANDIIITSQITINRGNLVINGNGHKLDGQNSYRIFLVEIQSYVTFKNIHFYQAYGNNYLSLGISGAAILFEHCSYCVVSECTFSESYGASRGGILAFTSGSTEMNITKCNFYNCTAASSGAIMNWYGARNGYTNTNTYTRISYCNFTNIRHTTGGNGAVMEFFTSNSFIDNCNFINNSAFSNGGALVLWTSSNNVTISNSKFINNTARGANGGAIHVNDASSKYCNIINCTFENNHANNNGGALSFNAQYASIEGCDFINNSAEKNGGAVYSNAKDSTVDNCKFENNNASDGVNFYATAGNSITITNCGFDLFYVSDDGTGDGLRSGAPTSFLNAIQSIENGGRIYLMGTFSNLYNQRVEKPVTLEGYNNATVVNLLGLNNRAMTIAGDNVTLKGITFKNSLITGNGGVILWNGANGKVESCTFDNNTAANGGAIYWVGANGNITSSTFTKNTATANGGAVYFTGNNSAIESSTFTNNKAVYGSAVFLSNAVSTFEIKDTSFTSNVASTAGTVAAEKLTTFSLGGNIFTSNTATTAGTNEYYFYENTPVITSSLVYVSPSGSATSNGLTESSPTTLDHAIDDIIEDGGQIVFLAGNYNFERTINNMNLTFVGRTGAVITGSRTSRVFTITGSSNIVFDGLTFSALSFSSTSVDSVISASSSNVDIKNSEFKTVTGTNLASVITYDASSSGNIVDSTFTSNTATNLININGNVNIKDSSFTSNTGRTSSVSYNSGSKGTISGTTFSSNSGTYRNLYVNSNNIAVTGNTFDTTAFLNSVSTVVYPNNVALSGTFNTGSNYAFAGISAKNGNTAIATGSVSSNTYSATWTKPLPGTYTVTLANTDNKGNTFNYASTPSVSVPVRLSTVYIGPSATGAKTGIDASNLATWADVAGILTTDGTVVFTAGTYSNFYGKTVSNSWKLTGSGSVILDANNNERIFTISANNVQISGLTFKNGKATDSYGSAIHWTGTGGSITNSVLTANTGRPITATNTVSISNSQLKDQISLTKSNINWGSTENITGTFAHSAPTTVNILFNGASQGSYTVTSNTVTADYDYKNTASRSVGSYVVTDLKNISKGVL